jgi:hypothetical protein
LPRPRPPIIALRQPENAMQFASNFESARLPFGARLVRAAIVPAIVMLSLAEAGCAGYRFGAASLYPPDIHTVYVPVFESDSFRRGLGERLTEAVVKAIETRTPYKVVGSAEADSVLTGKILTDSKRVLVEDPNDQMRETEVSLSIKVAWIDRKGDLVGASTGSKIPVPDDALSLTSTGKLVPEYGQSTVTAQQEAINKLAEKIVDMMESPW